MALNTEERKAVTYFTGYEVEHTVCYGKFTLFVVGTPPLEEILALAEHKKIDHIYFGTSQSFNPVDFLDWANWTNRIRGCLNKGLWVTLDFDVKYAEGVAEEGWNEHDRFVPMISVKIPYVKLFNYNTTVKIDDTTWGKSNPGVWTHQLHDLMAKNKFTYWDQYTQDTMLDK
jgi:hypothetical protein